MRAKRIGLTLLGLWLAAPVMAQVPTQEPESAEFRVSRNAFRPAEPQVLEVKVVSAISGRCRIGILNAGGELVKHLWLGDSIAQAALKVYWDGTNDAGDMVAAGVYVIHVETPRWAQVRRVAVLR